MTIEIGGVDLVEAVEIAGIVGGVLAMLVGALLLYLLVRPPRHVRQARRRSEQALPDESETLLDSMDRMEGRLAMLERLLADRSGSSTRQDQRSPELAEGNLQNGRTQ